jgi:hypothetical protein
VSETASCRSEAIANVQRTNSGHQGRDTNTRVRWNGEELDVRESSGRRGESAPVLASAKMTSL